MASIGGNERSREGRAVAPLAMAAPEGRASAEAANLLRDAGAFNQFPSWVKSAVGRSTERGTLTQQHSSPLLRGRSHFRVAKALRAAPIESVSLQPAIVAQS